MKLGIVSRLKVLANGDVSPYVKAFVNGDDLPTNGIITIDQAMRYNVLNACVRVRAETFASVPAMLYKKTDDGRESITDHTLYTVLHDRPNADMSPFNFKETLMTNFDTNGNTVSEILRNSKGVIVGLFPQSYKNVEIKINQDAKRLEYIIGQGTNQKTFSKKDIFHVPNMSFDGLIGLSPIAYAAGSIKLGLSYEQYGVNFYKNAALSGGVLQHPTALSEPAFERLRESFAKSYQGLVNAGKPIILEGGATFASLTINPIDAELLMSKYFQIEDICRIYRVPPHLVQDLRKSTNNNIEQQSLEFVMYTMLPIYKRFEDNINMQLLTPKERASGLFVEFKIDGLLRGDSKSRADAYAVGRQWGWLSVNDIRRLENMLLIPNGNIYMQPLNYGEAGNIDQQLTAQNKLAEDILKMMDERR